MVSQLTLLLKKHRRFYGSKIKLLSPAKINLYLNIVGKYPGGFNRIESIVERISLCDEITIKIKKEPSVKISSNIKSLESDQNLVVRAAKAIKKRCNLGCGFDVFLKKNIPIGSGLGGGSSNAATSLLGINTLLGLNLKRDELYQMGARLGSDVNFFLSQSKFAHLAGRGQVVCPLDIDSKLKHFIIWPALHLSTKNVYENARVKLTKFFNGANILQYALKKGDAFLIKKSIFNILEKSALSLSEHLRRAKQRLERKGIEAKLTGSGSAFFTLFSEASISKIRSVIPSNWVVFGAQTF